MIEKKKLEDFHNWILRDENLADMHTIIEKIIKNMYSQVLKPGDIAVDVGSHIGTHTIQMAFRVCPSGKVFSFEPIPHIYEMQKKKLEELSLQNVVLENVAVSNFVGKSSFRIVAESPGISSLKTMPHQKNHDIKTISVQVTTLSRAITSKDKVKFIKVDAEGGDFHVLLGAKQLLKNDRPVIVFECGARLDVAAQSYSYTKDDFISFFKKVEYDLFWILGLEFNPDLWCSRNPHNMVGIPSEKKEIFEIFWFSILDSIFRSKLK
jgi:FkbM family methyltransferase